MSDPVAQIIIWCSPVLFTVAAWAVGNWVSEIKDEITQTKGQIGGVKQELVDVGKSIVKISTDIEYLKDRDKLEKEKTDKFENHVVKILRSAKGRFE